MYLAYLDDSKAERRQQQWQVVSAVLIPAEAFFLAESLAAVLIADLIPPERQAKFEEFHAAELYWGTGAFDGIDQEVRFAAIRGLLDLLDHCGAKVSYGAIDLAALRKSPFGSAVAQDVAFRRCLLGTTEWLGSRVMEALGAGRDGSEFTALFIMDEAAQGDKATQVTLQRSFRSLRTRFRFAESSPAGIPFVHDDMYFGDSKFSIGIQIADLCSYFIGQHLVGDADTESFYRMIEPHIISTGMAE